MNIYETLSDQLGISIDTLIKIERKQIAYRKLVGDKAPTESEFEGIHTTVNIVMPLNTDGQETYTTKTLPPNWCPFIAAKTSNTSTQQQ